MDLSHFVYPFICQLALGLLPTSGDCEKCCCEDGYIDIYSSPCVQFFWAQDLSDPFPLPRQEGLRAARRCPREGDGPGSPPRGQGVGACRGLCGRGSLSPGATWKLETQEEILDSGWEAEGNVHLTKYPSQSQSQGLHHPLPARGTKTKVQKKMEKQNKTTKTTYTQQLRICCLLSFLRWLL